MKTVEKHVTALKKAIEFVDMFGENFGEPKLSDCVKIATEEGKVVITNQYGTTKTFVYGNAHLRQILDEISSNLESFKTKYHGYVMLHNGAHAGKIISTFSSKLALNESLATRERVAVVILKGKRVSTRYEITETFTEDF